MNSFINQLNKKIRIQFVFTHSKIQFYAEQETHNKNAKNH